MKSRKNNVVLEILAIALFILFFLPIILMIINAAKDNSSLVTTHPLQLPESFLNLFKNFATIWNDPNIMYKSSFVSSVIITVASLVVIVIFSSMAAWVLVRTKSKVSNVIFIMFVAAMVIPFQVVMFPLVSWFKIIGDATGIQLLRSYGGMVFAYLGFGVPFSIFLYHGFIKSIPRELEEAAYIDGCNRFQTFFYIIFPILKPVTVTILILNSIWIWNDFLLPLLILGKGNEIQTVPLSVANYVGAFVVEWELLLAAALLAMLPVIILFLIGQKYIIKGMVDGSVK